MDDDDYDGAQDSLASWRLAVTALREIGVRSGRYAPRDDTERRQADAGPCEVAQLDAVRCA